MIRLHAGRLLLVCDRADRTWHARVILGPKPEHQLEVDTGSVDLREAFIRAQRIYVASRRKLRPESEPRKCWDCAYWDMGAQRCEMGLPESKRSGGRYAAKCELYERA